MQYTRSHAPSVRCIYTRCMSIYGSAANENCFALSVTSTSIASGSPA
jgi:hypothetical protein